MFILLNRKVSTLYSFLVIFVIFFSLAAAIISQVAKLSNLEKPLPVLVPGVWEMVE